MSKYFVAFATMILIPGLFLGTFNQLNSAPNNSMQLAVTNESAHQGDLQLPSTINKLNLLLKQDFTSWSKRNKVQVPYNQNARMEVFDRFLNSSNYDAQAMNKLTRLQEQSFGLQNPTKASQNAYVINHSKPTVIGSEAFSLHGQNYTVLKVNYTLQANNSENIVSAAVVRSQNGSQIIDPLVAARIDYLSAWLIGTYGEVDYIYQNYFYDTVSFTGTNLNEAYAYYAVLQAIQLGELSVAFVSGIVAYMASILGLSLWVFTAGWDAADTTIMLQTYEKAYNADLGTGYVPTALQNDYLYTWYFGVLTGNGWGIHVYVDGTGWENGLIPMAFSGIDSVHLSNIAHSFVNEYGNQCIWLGAYQ